MKTLRNLTLALALGAVTFGSMELITPNAAEAGDRTCVRRCRNYAQDQFASCVDRGGDEARCAHRARAIYRRCVRENCGS